MILSPYVPMIFMGEEDGEDTPFQFFTDHIDPAIADGHAGRAAAEFAAFDGLRRGGARPPVDPETFARSALRPGGGRARDARSLPATCWSCAAAAPARRRRWSSTRTRRGSPCGAAPSEVLGNFGDDDAEVPVEARELVLATDRGRGAARTAALRLPALVGGGGPMSRACGRGTRSPSARPGTARGTNFSLFSENADAGGAVPLRRGQDRETRVDLTRAHRVHLARLPAGRRARASATPSACTGRGSPSRATASTPHKLLIDPYAKAIEGGILWDAANVLPYEPDGADADLVLDATDDADAIPKCIVDDPGFDWEGDRPPGTPWNETLIYEVHVKGFTKLHPAVREDLRGTYAGLASDEAIEHLRSLGVTAVELLPVHHIADEQHLASQGLTNYWGYSSIGFLAPHALYSATGHTGDAGARVQGHGEGPAPGGDRGDPRRGLQPHRRGQPPGADALVQGHRQPLLLPLLARGPALLRGLHGHRQQPQPGASPACCG